MPSRLAALQPVPGTDGLQLSIHHKTFDADDALRLHLRCPDPVTLSRFSLHEFFAVLCIP